MSRRTDAGHSVASQIAKLSGLPPWKVRLGLGEPQLTIEEAWLAFLYVREDEDKAIPALREFLRFAEIWELSHRLGEIPKEGHFPAAMSESWRGRGAESSTQRRPLSDQSYVLWADYFKETTTSESFFEWVINEAKELSEYSRLYENAPEKLKPMVLSLWEKCSRAATDSAKTLPKAKKAYEHAPEETEAKTYALEHWQSAALVQARVAKEFTAAFAVLRNGPKNCEAWSIALTKALDSVKKADEAMSLLALETLPEEHRAGIVTKTVDLALQEKKVYFVFYALSRGKHQNLMELLAEEFVLREGCGIDEIEVIVGHIDPKSAAIPKLRARWIDLRCGEFARWASLEQAKPLTSKEEKIEELKLAHARRIEGLWLLEIERTTDAKVLGDRMQRQPFELSPSAIEAAVKKLAKLVSPDRQVRK